MSASPSAHRADHSGRRDAQARRDSMAVALLLLAAFASFVFSVSLWFSGQHESGIFVGIWVPSILSLGTLVMTRRAR